MSSTSSDSLSSYPSPSSVLQYWFGQEFLKTAPEMKESFGLWFKKSDETDQHIVKTYGPLLEKLASDKQFFEEYSKRDIISKIGTLIVLDQFSRNAFRNTPKSFANDAKALELAEELRATEEWKNLPYWIRGFCLLPYEHSEKLEDQNTALQEFLKLAKEYENDKAGKGLCDAFADYARQHVEVIEKYGRFPHRNAILGRDNTEEEKIYLSKPGAGF
uniref:DUF924-domain-containing protein n=1 Tax=Percolomonas cosmopolitus TaxID=63605 RepID=A0A7S1KPB7_9EUKA